MTTSELKFPTNLVTRVSMGGVLRRLNTIRDKNTTTAGSRPFLKFKEVYGGATMVQGYFVCFDQLVFQDVVDLVMDTWPDLDPAKAWAAIAVHQKNKIDKK